MAKKEDTNTHNIAVAFIAARAASLILFVIGFSVFAKYAYAIIYNFDKYQNNSGIYLSIVTAMVEIVVYVGAGALIWCKARCFAECIVKGLDKD